MPDINHYAARSGRQIKEDGSLVNIADKIDALYNALVVNKNAGVSLTGSIPAGSNKVGKVENVDRIAQLGVISSPTVITAGSSLQVVARAQRLDYQQIFAMAAWASAPSAWTLNTSFRQGNTASLAYSVSVNKTGGTNGGKVADVAGAYYDCLIINGDAADKTLNYCEFVGWK